MARGTHEPMDDATECFLLCLNMLRIRMKTRFADGMFAIFSACTTSTVTFDLFYVKTVAAF